MLAKWYQKSKGKQRLKAEMVQILNNQAKLELFEDSSKKKLLWQGSGFGHKIKLVYPDRYPFEQINVHISNPKLPIVNNHIHADGTICYIKDNEWSPEFTAYAVFLTTIRFLDEFYSGVM